MTTNGDLNFVQMFAEIVEYNSRRSSSKLYNGECSSVKFHRRTTGVQWQMNVTIKGLRQLKKFRSLVSE